MIDSIVVRAVCMLLVATSLIPSAASAQGATNVVKLTPDMTQTHVRVGAYYTQVLLTLDGFGIPGDDDGKKHLGKALLSALGLGDKTRSLTISAVLSRGGQSLPEIPLATYTFDGKRRITDFGLVNSYVSPRWQLGASDVISVTLNYKYSEQATYDPSAITDNVKQLIPSDAIVSALGGPFITSVAKLTATVFSIAGTRTDTARNAADLLPYPGVVGARTLTYDLALPDGTALGRIKASLVVAPSLIRPAIAATAAVPTDLARQDGEDASSIALNLGSSTKNLLQDVEGLPTYATMSKGPSAAAVHDYCIKANGELSGYGITPFDRTLVVYRSLTDAGFDKDKFNAADNTWRTDCFSADDQAVLTAAIGLTFTPVQPPQVAQTVDLKNNWPSSLKDAMGCWVTGQTGGWCQKNAPSAEATLVKAFSDQVAIGVIELPGIDQTVLPVGRVWDKLSLISALHGKANTFACYQKGLILTKDGTPYNLGVELKDGLISTVQILKASSEAAQCLS